MATPPAASVKDLVDALARSHAASVTTCETFVNRALGAALRQRGLGPVQLQTAIFTRVGPGLLVNGAIPLKATVTKGHLRKRPHAVGVLVNTLPLRDPIARTALAPGAALVELRPVTAGEFAFDFVGGDGRTRFSTRASIKDRGGFESLPLDRPLAASGLSLIDIDITGGSGPDDPFPPGTFYICVSFLAWRYCGFIDTGPTVPQGPILV
jgi:hypothetical protein